MAKDYPKAKNCVEMGQFVLHKPFPSKFGYFFTTWSL
jgi:hypothetical protein